MHMHSPTLYANAMPVFEPTLPEDKIGEMKHFNISQSELS